MKRSRRPSIARLHWPIAAGTLIVLLVPAVAPSLSWAAPKSTKSKSPKPSTKAFCTASKKWQAVELAFIDSSDSDYAGWSTKVRLAVKAAYETVPTKAIKPALFTTGFNSWSTKADLGTTLAARQREDAAAFISEFSDLKGDANRLMSADAMGAALSFNDYVKKTCKYDMFGPIGAAAGGNFSLDGGSGSPPPSTPPLDTTPPEG